MVRWPRTVENIRLESASTIAPVANSANAPLTPVLRKASIGALPADGAGGVGCGVAVDVTAPTAGCVADGLAIGVGVLGRGVGVAVDGRGVGVAVGGRGVAVAVDVAAAAVGVGVAACVGEPPTTTSPAINGDPSTNHSYVPASSNATVTLSPGKISPISKKSPPPRSSVMM